jgi:hypothetical protein
MTDADRIEDIRRKSKSLHGDGYLSSGGVYPSEAASDIAYLLDQLDKTTMALEQCGGPCPRCDERDRHDGEAQDGLTNAYEMAGLQ